MGVEIKWTGRAAARTPVGIPPVRGAVRAAVLLATALLAGLAGCGPKVSPTAAKGAAAPPSPATASAAPAGTVADMVNAVPAGKASTAFSFKFDIRSRPTPAQPVDIEVALTPGSEFDRVQMVFHGSDGLEVRSGAAMAPVERPEVGVPLHHILSVVPNGPGIYSISAVVQSESAEGSISRTYSIPLIAGDGLAAPSPESAAAAAAAAAADGPHPAS